MADDLIIKFFQQDLTETEEKALSDILGSSTEEANRFFQHAEAAYRFCGLPEPHRAGGGFPRGFLPGGGMNMGLWLSLGLTAGLATWAAWHFMHPPAALSPNLNPQALVVASIPPKAPSSSIPESLPEKTRPISSLPQMSQAPAHESKIEEEPSGSSSPENPKVDKRPPLETIPAITPVEASTSSKSPHTNLEVLVHRRAPGQVKVQVLDSAGNPVLLLFQGTLQPGSWVFDWNGVLGNGEKALAGTYQIEVVSGRTSQRKKVVIRKK